jgi:hypothetical protein
MRKHNGMRPQDVAILLKICALGQQPWQMAGLASSLRISISEVSESLNRSQLAGLIDFTKKKVNRQNLLARQEAEILISYIDLYNLWVERPLKKLYIGEGAEQKIFEDQNPAFVL